MASKYWRDVQRIVRSLYDRQRDEWSQREAKDQGQVSGDRSPALQTRNVLLAEGWRWSPVGDTKLDAMFATESTVTFARERLVMLLPPFPKEQRDFVPVLTMMYDPAIECIEMRVGMYRIGDDGIPCGLGFRLESPTSVCQGQTTPSSHDFYHVQLVKTLEDYAPPLRMPDWLPEYQPSICVRADNPVEAIFSLILSLYGLEYFKRFIGSVKSQIANSNIELIRRLLT